MKILNLYERNDAGFLEKLADALKDCDFSGKNFRSFSPRQYSLMVDNYQIQVNQTGVFYYPTKLHKLIDTPKYAFKPGELERYEVYVFENRFPMHIQESRELLLGTMVDVNIWRSNYNVLLMAATMVNNRGFYRTSCFDARPQDMFNKENMHLFASAKRLYHIFNDRVAQVSDKTIFNEETHALRPVRDKYEMGARRECLLQKIQETFKRQK